MNNEQTQHVVHTALIKKPTIAGVTRGVFGTEFIVSILLFTSLGVSVLSFILIGAICLVLHPQLRKMHRDDPLGIQFLVISLFKNQTFYPGQPDINSQFHSPNKSIPQIK